MGWLKTLVRRLFGPGVQWLVPAMIVCPVCGGTMERGRVLVEKYLSFWTSNNYTLTSVYFERTTGGKWEILRGFGSQLAYRCEECASVFLTKPETIGKQMPDPELRD